jgi:hypothetical protein
MCARKKKGLFKTGYASSTEICWTYVDEIRPTKTMYMLDCVSLASLLSFLSQDQHSRQDGCYLNAIFESL